MPEMIDFHTTRKVSARMLSECVCTSPKIVIGAEQDQVANMFGSHDWKVVDSSPHGKRGVLIHFHCVRCDAEGFATVMAG
jgi:hypothetical protein